MTVPEDTEDSAPSGEEARVLLSVRPSLFAVLWHGLTGRYPPRGKE